MPDAETPRGARKALKFTGDVKAGKYVPGIPAHDLTQEQAEVWLREDQYQAALDSGYYDAATKTEAKAIEAEASGAEAEPPKRRTKHEE